MIFRRGTISILAVLTATLVATPALSENLLHHWPGDGNALDVVGGINGSLVGNTSFTTGQVGDAFSFDGSGDYVDIDQSASFLGTDPFSVSAWIQTSSSAEQVIAQQRSQAAWMGEWIIAVSWYHDNGNLSDPGKLCYWDHDGGQGLGFCSAQRVDDGEWHHVVFTRDAAGEGSLYIDGILDASQSRPASPKAFISIDIAIGGDRRDGIRWFDGQIDEVKFHGSALTQEEIDADMTVSSDADGDGVSDDNDSCSDTPADVAVDGNGCGGAQNIAVAAPCDGDWKNHGQYVSAADQAAEDQVAAGLLTEEEAEAIVSEAAQSMCGHREGTAKGKGKKAGKRAAGMSESSWGEIKDSMK